MALKEKLINDAVDPHVTQARFLIRINFLSSHNGIQTSYKTAWDQQVDYQTLPLPSREKQALARCTMHMLGQFHCAYMLLTVANILVICIYICKLTGIPLMPWNPGTPIGPWRKRVLIIFHFINLYISVTCKVLFTATFSVLDFSFQNQKEQTISCRFFLTAGVSEDRNWASELDWMPNECFRNVLIRQFKVKI